MKDGIGLSEETVFFSDAQRVMLHALSAELPLCEFLENERTVETFLTDEVVLTGYLEGNAYTKRGAECLLAYGLTEAGKPLRDAVRLDDYGRAARFVTYAAASGAEVIRIVSEGGPSARNGTVETQRGAAEMKPSELAVGTDASLRQVIGQARRRTDSCEPESCAFLY